MSITTSLSVLSEDQKELILKTLEFENPNTKQWITPYTIDEKEMTITLPYAFARNELNLKPPERISYPEMTATFQGSLRDYQQSVKVQAIQHLNKTGCCLLSLHDGEKYIGNLSRNQAKIKDFNYR